MKFTEEPTKNEFEERYNVTISDEAFEYLKTFLWDICCSKNTKQFYKDLDNKKVNIQELVNYLENTVQTS